MAILPFTVIRSADEAWAMPSREKKRKKTKKAKEWARTVGPELEILAVGLVDEPPLEAVPEAAAQAVHDAEP
jgi:hypothetical protein